MFGNKKQIKCPKCGSIQCEFLQNKRKGFSVGKAIGGGLLTGGYRCFGWICRKKREK